MIKKLQIKTLTFNDNSNYFITEVPGLEMPPIRVMSYNLPSEHFGIFVGALYGKRAFSIRGWVVGSDVSDLIIKRDALQNALGLTGAEEPVLITLSNDRLIQINAVPLKLDFSVKAGNVNACEFNAGFEASFPFLTGQTENSQNIVMATGGGGTVPPPVVPMALNPDSGGKVYAINNGNAPYYPTVRFTGPVQNPQIRNETTGKAIVIAVTLVAGEYIDIDFLNKTVIDNYGTNRYSLKSGDWWFLQPGTNEVRFTAGAYDASALATIYYRDSYLGL